MARRDCRRITAVSDAGAAGFFRGPVPFPFRPALNRAIQHVRQTRMRPCLFREKSAAVSPVRGQRLQRNVLTRPIYALSLRSIFRRSFASLG